MNSNARIIKMTFSTESVR